jgi:uncharacterized protein DUF3467
MNKKNEETVLGASDIPAGALTKVSDQIRVSSEDFFSYYANSIAVSMSMWDVRFVFGEHIGEQDGKAVIEESVRILLSREIAKVLHKLLTDQIAAYEKMYGVIKIPDMAQVFKPEEDEHQEALQE